jgi:hypothetical protein
MVDFLGARPPAIDGTQAFPRMLLDAASGCRGRNMRGPLASVVIVIRDLI